jgi:RNA polymerase sigma-70 factor (ECF subfamily)
VDYVIFIDNQKMTERRNGVLAEITVAEESSLITQAQRGDREAFAELVCRYRAGAINVVYRMCGDSNLAEDAAQVAFIRAWQNLPKFQPRAAFRCWLYRIALNAARDMLRREKPEVDIDDLFLALPGDKVETHVEQQERAQQVRQAVLSLPEASRAALVLREYEGLSYQEIGEALEISTGTVMSRLNYARGRLAELLNPLLEEV